MRFYALACAIASINAGFLYVTQRGIANIVYYLNQGL